MQTTPASKLALQPLPPLDKVQEPAASFLKSLLAITEESIAVLTPQGDITGHKPNFLKAEDAPRDHIGEWTSPEWSKKLTKLLKKCEIDLAMFLQHLDAQLPAEKQDFIFLGEDDEGEALKIRRPKEKFCIAPIYWTAITLLPRAQ